MVTSHRERHDESASERTAEHRNHERGPTFREIGPRIDRQPIIHFVLSDPHDLHKTEGRKQKAVKKHPYCLLLSGCNARANCSSPSTMRGPGRLTKSGLTRAMRLWFTAGVVAKSRRNSASLTSSLPWLSGRMISSGARATTVSREN